MVCLIFLRVGWYHSIHTVRFDNYFSQWLHTQPLAKQHCFNKFLNKSIKILKSDIVVLRKNVRLCIAKRLLSLYFLNPMLLRFIKFWTPKNLISAFFLFNALVMYLCRALQPTPLFNSGSLLVYVYHHKLKVLEIQRNSFEKVSQDSKRVNADVRDASRPFRQLIALRSDCRFWSRYFAWELYTI